MVIIMQIKGDWHVKHLSECLAQNRCFLDDNLIIPDLVQMIGEGLEDQMEDGLAYYPDTNANRGWTPGHKQISGQR